jgi:hypothetical protein
VSSYSQSLFAEMSLFPYVRLQTMFKIDLSVRAGADQVLVVLKLLAHGSFLSALTISIFSMMRVFESVDGLRRIGHSHAVDVVMICTCFRDTMSMAWPSVSDDANTYARPSCRPCQLWFGIYVAWAFRVGCSCSLRELCRGCS